MKRIRNGFTEEVAFETESEDKQDFDRQIKMGMSGQNVLEQGKEEQRHRRWKLLCVQRP